MLTICILDSIPVYIRIISMHHMNYNIIAFMFMLKPLTKKAYKVKHMRLVHCGFEPLPLLTISYALLINILL